MNLELEGTALLVQRVLDNLKNTVNEDNVDWITARMVHGKTAVSQLIESKCAPLIPEGEDLSTFDYSFYFVCQAALFSIQSRTERNLDLDSMPLPDIFLEYLLEYVQDKIEDDLLLSCWTEYTHEHEWSFYTEEYIDVSDGAKAKQRKWLTCPPQKVSVKHVSEIIATGTYGRIQQQIDRLMKHLYLNVTLDEWVTAYNTDTKRQNDPEEIKSRIQKVLMES